MALQFRRGTDAERQQFGVFAEGEPIYVTDTGELYVGDGETPGGQRIVSTLSQESNPELGGDLDLNDYNITGIGNIAIDGNLSVLGLGQSLDLNDYNIIGRGNINIDGSIQATGVINIGAGEDDNIIVGGEISSSLIPADDRAYDLGSGVSAWRNGFFEGLEVDGEISANSIAVNDIYTDDSTSIYDGNLDKITVSSVITAGLRVQGVDQNGERAGIEITTDGDSDDEYSLFNISGYNESSTGQSIVYSRSRGSVESPNPLQQGDEILSQVWFGADSNMIPSFVAGIRVIVDKAVSAGVVPGSLELATTNDQGVPSLGLFIDSEQTSLFGGAAQLAAYADAASRDAAITTPAAGMLVFVEDISKFQGYDGTAWIDIN